MADSLESAGFTVSKADEALAAAAKCNIHSRGHISKDSFDDDVERARDQAMYEAGGGKGQDPTLGRKELIKWVRAEYAILLIYIFTSWWSDA
mmetsp:Transcript_19067/g.47860  ORF Transcript_19067/g.47860 Transcript_19067/m.47860 type:complete len:92 (+) Transcript_19067:461-736(+)